MLHVVIDRQAKNELRARLKDYPAVALIGPRQCGKTTLAGSMEGEYFDLEQEQERLRLDLVWDELVHGSRLIILDEAQAWPDVFVRLRGAIDRDRKRSGRFLLLGSVSPALMQQVSESLAGRLSLLELTTLLYEELPTQAARNRHWFFGGYPDGGVLAPRRYPVWELNYLQLLSQRDLPNWGLSAKPQTTDRLLKMVAALHGQIWNASRVGQSLGLTYKTVNTYLDYLVGAFLVRRLQPYQANLRKRLQKSPKVFWRDSGLLHALLNVADREHLINQPWVGASWEGYVIEQAIGALTSHGTQFSPWYFRTSRGDEIDLVLEIGTSLWAIDVKLTTSPGADDMARLQKAAEMIGATHQFIVSQTNKPVSNETRGSLNVEGLLERLYDR